MFFPKQIENKSYIRILNTLPDKNHMGLYVYANKNIIAKDLGCEDFSEYVPLIAGDYTIYIYPNKDKKCLLFSKQITLEPKKIYTLTFIEKNNNMELLSIHDIIRPMPSGALLLRFGHLAPILSTANLTLPDGTIVFKNIDYTNITNYTPLRPGILTFQVRDAKTDNILIKIPNIRFKPNRYYSIYAVGNGTKEAPLQVLIPLDGNSYLQV